MKNPVLGFVLLIALAGCAVQSPVEPDPSQELLEEQSSAESTREPLSPAQARALLQERGVPYTQRSFLAAAGDGDLEIVQLFVQAGMDLNVQNPDENYDTALMRAAAGGHLDVVRYLYEQGALLYSAGWSPISNGRCIGDLVGELRHKDPDFCGKQNALVLAAWQGHLPVVEYIIEQRRYIPHIDFINYRYGPNSALMIAAYGGHLEVVKFLREHISPNYKGSLGGQDKGCLGWAAHQGHLDIVRFLVVDEGTEINPGALLGGQRITDTTPLMMAASQGQTDVVRFLLDRGADIFVREGRQFMDQDGNVWEEFGSGALDIAIYYGQDEVVQLLIYHWAYTYGVDGRDDHGRTVLMCAALWGNMDSIRFLVDNGAPINAQTAVGATALMFAAFYGHIDAVQFLLDNGADPTLESYIAYYKKTHTALSIAQQQGHDDVVSLLNDIG